MRERLEYWLVVVVARTLGRMPRGLARLFARGLAFTVYWLFGRLRRVGMCNLQMALPELSPEARKKILRGVYVHLGYQLVEFCRMTRYTAQNSRNWMRTEGLEHYLAAQARGKGVLVITGHLGAWELSSFYHSLMGHPMGMVIRRLDNRRLDDPGSGRVSIDGIDIRDIRLTDLAALVGVVSQETYLLHTTVRENLRYAKPGATDAEIEDAARAAQIHDLIAGLPDGYDTMVGSRGYRFSGGEKQRIAIARTLLRDPRVLVLDEATSALDTETERAVQRAFDALARGRTTITIAHRLSTVRNADQIGSLTHGHIIEAGDHTSLMAGQGRYADLAAEAARPGLPVRRFIPARPRPAGHPAERALRLLTYAQVWRTLGFILVRVR